MPASCCSHRAERQHQGAARLQLRYIRRRGPADRQRAACPRASRRHGRKRAAQSSRGAAPHSGRAMSWPLTTPMQRRHASAGYHCHHAGLRRGGTDDPLFPRQSRPPCRCRRHHAGLDALGFHYPGRGGCRHRRFPLVSGGAIAGRRNFARCSLTTPHPARSPDVNLADIAAQVAANRAGAAGMARVIAEWGWATVTAYMAHIRANAAEAFAG